MLIVDSITDGNLQVEMSSSKDNGTVSFGVWGKTAQFGSALTQGVEAGFPQSQAAKRADASRSKISAWQLEA